MARVLFRGRIEVAPRTAVIATGDLVAIGLFALAGELRHGGTVLAAAGTVGQFGLGWLVAAVVLGAYAPGPLGPPRRAAGLAVASWALAVAIGGLLRVLTEVGARLDPTFLVVSLGAGGVLLAAWRAGAAAWLE